MGERGRPCGRSGGERRRRRLSGGSGKRVRGGREGVQRERRSRGSRASPWRREGVGEAATAKQEVEASRARVRAVSVLLAEEEEDKGEEEVGWAGQMGWPAGPGKWRQVVLLSLCFYLLFSIYLFCSVLF